MALTVGIIHYYHLHHLHRAVVLAASRWFATCYMLTHPLVLTCKSFIVRGMDAPPPPGDRFKMLEAGSTLLVVCDSGHRHPGAPGYALHCVRQFILHCRERDVDDANMELDVGGSTFITAKVQD